MKRNKKWNLSRRQLLSDVVHDCMKELFQKAQPSANIDEYLKQNQIYTNNICRYIYGNWNLVLSEYRRFCEGGRNFGVPVDYVIVKEDFNQADEVIEEYIRILERNKSELPDEYYDNIHRNRSNSHKGKIPPHAMKVYCDGIEFQSVNPELGSYEGSKAIDNYSRSILQINIYALSVIY